MAVCNTVEDFLDDIVEKHLAELRANDQEYIELNRKLAEGSDEIEKALHLLDRERKKTFDEYETLRNQEESIENRFLYRAGILDAVKLLKGIGVI